MQIAGPITNDAYYGNKLIYWLYWYKRFNADVLLSRGPHGRERHQDRRAAQEGRDPEGTQILALLVQKHKY